MADPKAASRPVDDSRVGRVADVYAQALLGAAEAAGQKQAVVEELKSLVEDVLARYPEWERVLSSGLVAPEEKIASLDRVLGSKASPVLLKFLRVLAKHERLDALGAIQRKAQALFDESSGRIPVQVRTATPLDAKLQKSIEEAVRRIAGREAQIQAEVDAAMIGGIVLRIGDTVYDASIASRLEKMRTQMIHRSVHEIQSRRDRFRHPGGN